MAPHPALLALCFAAWTCCVSAAERTVTLAADNWCPYNCRDVPGNRGILVEITAEALALEGFRLDYTEMPWSRAILGVREGEFDAIVGAGRTETPDFHFPPEPLAVARHSFFTLPSATWEYRGLESLREVRIGVVQDYSYGDLYEDYIYPYRNSRSRLAILRGNQVLPRLVRMLELGRIDALVAEERVLAYHFASLGQVNPLRYAGLVSEEPLYVAFSPAIEDGRELADALGRGLLRIHGPPAIPPIPGP